MPLQSLSRRSFFALTAAAPIASAFAQGKRPPVGLELYSVRNELKTDLMGTVRAVAKMGYECVEFFSPYYAWTPDYAKQVRQMMDAAGLRAGYHNHQLEFKPIEGKRPIEVLAANTGKDVMLQLDVGTCIEAGSDPVAWVEANPGRIRSMHCKDWSPEKGYKVLLGDGVAPWKKLFAAAEKTGGLEFYLVEQEGSDYPEMETAQRCLANFRKLHG